MGDPARHVVLVGLMGVGKTTVGRRLAKELQRPFADVDEQVELRAGLTVPAIFRDLGEPRFRELEAEVLGGLLARDMPLVLAAGGGAVTGEGNRAALAASGAYVVWLRASAGFLADRTDATHRPLLAAGDPEATLTRLLAERGPLYERVADVAVDVEPFHVGDEKPKRALARHIAELLADAVPLPRPLGPGGSPLPRPLGPGGSPLPRPLGPGGSPLPRPLGPGGEG